MYQRIQQLIEKNVYEIEKIAEVLIGEKRRWQKSEYGI